MEKFGFIHDSLQIKVLLLFILNRLPDAVSMDKLAEVAMCDPGVSYFDFSDALADLISSEHVTNRDGKYAITEKGRKNGSAIESTVPYSVRVKAEKSAAELARSMSRAAMIKASHTMSENGCATVSLALSDGVDSILNMEILAGDEKLAASFERSFRRNAEKIYHSVVDILLNADRG